MVYAGCTQLRWTTCCSSVCRRTRGFFPLLFVLAILLMCFVGSILPWCDLPPFAMVYTKGIPNLLRTRFWIVSLTLILGTCISIGDSLRRSADLQCIRQCKLCWIMIKTHQFISSLPFPLLFSADGSRHLEYDGRQTRSSSLALVRFPSCVSAGHC